MLNTSALLRQPNEQSSWVSQLASLRQSNDQYHQVSTVSPCWPHTAAALTVQPEAAWSSPGVKWDQDVHGDMSAFDGALVLLQEADTQAQWCTETSSPDEVECHDPILPVRKWRGSPAYPASAT